MRNAKWLWAIVLLATLLAIGAIFACGDDDDDDNDADDDDADDDVADDDTSDDDVIDDDAVDDDVMDDDTTDDDTFDDDTGDDDTTIECETVIIGNLEWTQCDNGYDINHYDAETYAADLDLADFDDWRLPTRQELLGLYDEDFTQDTACFLPAHIIEPFHLSCSWLWTGEVAPWYDEIAWSVGFTHGTVTIDLREGDQRHRVLAVRDL